MMMVGGTTLIFLGIVLIIYPVMGGRAHRIKVFLGGLFTIIAGISILFYMNNLFN